MRRLPVRMDTKSARKLGLSQGISKYKAVPTGMKEKHIQRAILDWLAAERIWHIRLNTGAFSGVHNGKRRFVKFGRPGMADILAVFWKEMTQEVRIYWIEVKGPGGVQSEQQKNFQCEVERECMSYLLAHCLEDVIDVIKN